MLALENGQKDFYYQLLERLVPEDQASKAYWGEEVNGAF